MDLTEISEGANLLCLSHALDRIECIDRKVWWVSESCLSMDPIKHLSPLGKLFFFFLTIPVIVSSLANQWLLNYICCTLQRCSKTIRWYCQGRPSTRTDASVVSDIGRLQRRKKSGLSAKCQRWERVRNGMWQGKIRMSFGFEWEKKQKKKTIRLLLSSMNLCHLTQSTTPGPGLMRAD